VVSDGGLAEKLVDDIANDRNARGKTPKDYRVDTEARGGNKYWLVTDKRLETLKRDALWEAYRLGIPRSNIHIVKAEQMFETASFPQ
jgi:hypothetical protein